MLALFHPSGRQLATVAVMALVMQGCVLDLTGLGSVCTSDAECSLGEVCEDGMCVASDLDAGERDAGDQDAGPVGDSGPTDSGTGDDAGPQDAGPGLPAHCMNDTLDTGVETDIDCGGECSGCAMCRRCTTPADCATGSCSSGLCDPSLQPVTTRSGTRDAFVREDGYILLAYYAPGTYPAGFDTSVAQTATSVGGPAAGAGYAPTPCSDPGHIPYSDFDPAGREVRIECGTDYSDIQQSVGSDTLFTSFASGTAGTPGDTGSPGWGAIASVGSGEGRARGAMCGEDGGRADTGGIAYCEGSRVSGYDNHLASFSVASSGNPFVGCGGSGCNATTCSLGVWVWLAP